MCHEKIIRITEEMELSKSFVNMEDAREDFMNRVRQIRKKLVSLNKSEIGEDASDITLNDSEFSTIIRAMNKYGEPCPKCLEFLGELVKTKKVGQDQNIEKENEKIVVDKGNKSC